MTWRRVGHVWLVILLSCSSCGPGARTPPGDGDADVDVDADTDAEADVGDACMPQTVPDGGFRDTEVYLETDSADCSGRTCLVNQLEGDPRVTDPAEPTYVSPAELERRVYCTCKCDGADPDYTECPTCPEGFECCPAFTIGPPDIRGSYCVRQGTCPSE